MSVDIARLGFRVESLEAELAAQRLDNLTKAANDSATAAQRLAKEADKVGRSMQKLGKSMSMYVTAPIAAIGAASVKLGTDFGSTLAKMNTLVGVSRDEIRDFRAEILKIGPSVGRGPVELADALFAVTSAGQRGAQAMETLTNAAKASAIGLGDTRTIALAATAAVQAYGESNMDSKKSLEILIGTIEQGNLAAEELAPVLGRVIGIAAELGVQFEDLGAFIATFTRLGVNADEAATALRGTLASIQKPNEDAIKAFKKLGTSVEEVRRRIKDEGFIKVFQELVIKSRELGVDLVALVPNVRALSGVLGVFGGEGKVAEEVLEGVAGAVGTMEERFQAVIDLDPAFAFQQMSAELQGMGVAISNELLPSVLAIAGEIKELVAGFRELKPETREMIIRITVLTALVGPLLIILGSVVRILGAMVGAMSLAAGASAMGALAAGFKGLLGLLTGPVGIAAALGVVVKLIGDAYVQSLEDAIVVTGDFKAMLDDMEMTGLQSNLMAVAGEVDRLLELRNKQAALVESMRGARGEGGFAEAQLDANLAKLDEYNLFLEQAIRLRDSYTERLRMSAQAAAEAAAATEELNTVESATSEIVELTEQESKALQTLINKLKPAEAETKKLAKAKALLDKALKAGVKNGGISKKVYDELAEALAKLRIEMKRVEGMNPMVAWELEQSIAFVENLEQMEAAVDAVAASFDPFGAQLKQLNKAQEDLNKAWEAGVFEGREQEFHDLTESIERARLEVEIMGTSFQQTGAYAMSILQEMQGLFHQDSAAAEALRTAMIALNIVMGVHAVLKQLAEGDVYSAIPRALAVAAMVASLGVATGASGSAASTRSLQETQGTGSVLGDAEAKTDSIVNATEITADATSELVGINRGMLNALTALAGGTSGAATQIGRNLGDWDFGELPKGLDIGTILTGGGAVGGGIGGFAFGALFGPIGAAIGALLGSILGGVIGNFINKLIGGKSKVLDEGIRIVGGTLAELTTEVLAQAFQLYKAKKHVLDDYDEYWKFADLPEEVGTQFALVFGAIADTVLEAAMALGMDMDEIEAAIMAFEIGDIDISMKDLSAEEVEEELLAVFGKVFDDLAGAVIPWLDQFQKAGEGLGETLVRVASSVQIVQEAFAAFGMSVDDVDPETFARMSVELVEMVGGVEEFLNQFASFFDTFASDADKLEFITSQFSRAMESVGLVVPETRDGMWELMQSLDATTEEGRAQIAMLLELADVADEYYDLMEKGTEKLADQAKEFAQQVDDFLGLGYAPLRELTDQFVQAMKAAKSLGASQKEYAMIVRKFDLELKRMAASLRISVLSMTQQLFGGTELDDRSPAQPIVDGMTEVREVANPLFEEWISALKSIRGYIDDLKIDETYSILTPAQRLAEAQRQFDDLLRKAQAGDAEAAAGLPDAARALLENARFMFASGQEYTDIYNAVIAGMESVEMPSDITPTITEEITTGDTLIADTIVTATDAIIQALEQYLLAVDLSTALKDLAQVLDTSVIALAQELGVPLKELAEILGVQLDPIDDTTAAAIGEMAQLLGANVFELIEALGINLMDLAATLGISMDTMSQALATQLGEFAVLLGANVFELAERLGVSINDLALTFGVSIAEFSAEQFNGLIMFADALGVSMLELGTSLGLQLGSIADETSLISEGFDAAVDELPPETGDELAPYLTAIRDASDPTERELALQALGNYILGLPPEIAAPLIPFLDAMGFHQIEPQLQAILEIAYTNAEIMGYQSGIIAAIKAIDLPDIDIDININTGGAEGSSSGGGVGDGDVINPTHFNPLGSFHSGGYVPQTGLYQLHEGEFVIDKNRDTITTSGNDELTAAELKAIRSVLTDIREQNRRYQEEDLQRTGSMQSSLDEQTEQTRRLANA